MTEEKEEQLQYLRAKEPDFLTKTRFEDLEIPEVILAGLKDAGVISCTPIQEQVLPVSLLGKDVAGQAQTGTGKTIAFLVTIFTRLLSIKRKNNLPSALIVAPTRELALQIYDDAELIGKHTDLVFSQVIRKRLLNIENHSVDMRVLKYESVKDVIYVLSICDSTIKICCQPVNIIFDSNFTDVC